MTFSTARRDLLRGRVATPDVAAIRPPYAVHEEKFLALCDKCADCAKACAEGVIKIAGDAYPKMLFANTHCTFCEDCAKVCKTGALNRDNARRWSVVASIGGNCLAFNGIVCRSCSDSCEEEAISFRLMIGGRSMPLVSSEKCTGCGECVAICPNDSINMRELQEAVA